MRDIDVAAIILCLVCGALISLRAELLRPRMGGYLDAPVHVRWSMHGLGILFVARAFRIALGYGEADVSEVLLYAGITLVAAEQIATMVKRAWSGAVEDSKADVIPEIKVAVKEAAAEAIPGWVQDLAKAPADYERRGALYPPGGVTPVDPTVPAT